MYVYISNTFYPYVKHIYRNHPPVKVDLTLPAPTVKMVSFRVEPIKLWVDDQSQVSIGS